MYFSSFRFELLKMPSFVLCQAPRLNSHSVSRLTAHIVWSTKYRITDEMVNEYLEHQRKQNDGSNTNFIIEK